MVISSPYFGEGKTTRRAYSAIEDGNWVLDMVTLVFPSETGEILFAVFHWKSMLYGFVLNVVSNGELEMAHIS